MDIVKLMMNAPSTDLVVAVLLILGAILYSLSLGREQIMCILVAVYVALALVAHAPIIGFLGTLSGQVQQPYFHLATFGIVFALMFGFLTYGGAFTGLGYGPAKLSWTQSFIISLFQVGLLTSIVLTLLPLAMTQGLTAQTKLFFMSEYARSAWLVLPIVGLALLPTREPRDMFLDEE